MKKKSQKIEIGYILIIVILAAAGRISFFHDYRNTPAYPVLEASDSQAYYYWSRDIESGKLIPDKAFMKWPFYAYFLGFIFKFFGIDIAAVYLLQYILGIINCLLLFYIGKKLFNIHLGFIAALFYCFYALFLFFESLLVYTTLSIFFNLLFFLYLINISNKPLIRDFILPGLLLGLCTITQANVLLFGILAVIWILIMADMAFKSRLCCFVVFIFFSLLVISSATLTNYIAEDDFVFIAGHLGINFYIGNNPQASGLFDDLKGIGQSQEGMFRDATIRARHYSQEDLKTSGVSRYWLKRALIFIKNRPGKYLKLLAKKMNFVFSPDEFIHDMEFSMVKDKIRVFRFLFTDLRFIMPLSLLGMFLGLKSLKKTMLIYLASGVFLMSIAVFFVDSRYRIMAVPFLIIFASFAVFRSFKAAKKRNYRLLGILSASAVVLYFGLQYNPHNKPQPPTAFERFFYQALEYEFRKDYTQAIKFFEIADRIRPGDEDVLFRLAVLYYRLNDFSRSRQTFERVLSINGLNVDAYYNLGFLYNLQGDYHKAVAGLEKACSFEPENPKYNFELGLAYKGIGETDKAKRALKMALKRISPWRQKDKNLIIGELNQMISSEGG
ncbi:MAG: tetratricopeptide repeat protein [Candidatus Omnitrophica bacterium]|nr:tetratricopeptide repeat protein [Candidatus Omnitrophota bacterium]